jgi:putative ABC transport system permease protein
MPDYRRHFRPPVYTRLLGEARRARCFEPAYFEMLEERIQELEASGSLPARLRARLRFQLDVLLLALDCLRLPVPPGESAAPAAEPRRGDPRLALVWRDVRQAARGLLRSPGFTAAALLTLALGIGANTAVFSVVHAVLLRSLPYAEAERLVLVYAHDLAAKEDHSYFSLAASEDYRRLSRSFDALIGFSPRWSFTLRGDAEPERVFGYYFSAGGFEMLGVRPLLGRSFGREDDRAGAAPVALVSHGLWQRRFGGDPAIVGKSLAVDGGSVTVIGVLPAGFRWLEDGELWLPLALNSVAARGRGVRVVFLAGRLREGIAPGEAQAELSRLAGRLAEENPGTDKGLGAHLVSLRDEVVGTVRPLLLALMGAVALVLLIACANVANLLLARTAARRKSLAIRAAIGAGRGRLVGESLAESASLSLVGGVAGAALAAWGVQALVALAPEGLPRRDAIAVDGSVLVFTLFASLATGVLFGLLPALQASRVDLNEALKEGGRSAAPSERHRLRQLLVVGEVALSLIVVAAALLLVRSFARLQRVDAGLDVKNVVSMDLSGLPADAAQRVAMIDELYLRLAALPGVVAAGDTTRLPLAGVGGNPSANIEIEGRPARPGEQPQIDFRRASRNYFQAVGVPVLSGRTFAESERLGMDAPPAALINEAAAKAFFPGEDPVGKRVRLGSQQWQTIVGVVGSVRHLGLQTAPRPEAYIHTLQAPPTNPQLAVRTAADPGSAIAGIRRVIRSLDPGIVIARTTTMAQLRDRSLAGPRFNSVLFGVFAALALALGLVGVYGVMAASVAQRRPEIGIRLALGARRSQVLGLVVGQALRLAAAGALLGVAGAAAATRVMRSLLFETSPTDPTTFGLVVVTVLTAALLATGVPALQAARLDPLTTLRGE